MLIFLKLGQSKKEKRIHLYMMEFILNKMSLDDYFVNTLNSVLCINNKYTELLIKCFAVDHPRHPCPTGQCGLLPVVITIDGAAIWRLFMYYIVKLTAGICAQLLFMLLWLINTLL